MSEIVCIIFVCILFVCVFLTRVKNESFTQNYSHYRFNECEKKDFAEQRYLTFLERVTKGQSVGDAYKQEETNVVDVYTSDPCVAVANYLCEFTDPALYVAESKYFPPRWLVPTLAKMSLPKHTNLTCFNTNYDCCKQSRKIVQ